MDDHRYTADPRIQQSGHVVEYFANYVWAQFIGGPMSFYRPVFLLWMRLNFMLSELSPWGWHVLSVAKHVAVTVLLAALLWRLLHNWIAALLGSTLFALHPAHAESVCWVSVPDPLTSIFLIVSLLFYATYGARLRSVVRVSRKRPRKASTASAPRGSGWLIASALAFFVALLTKETAIIFPAVILVLAYSVERNLDQARQTSQPNAPFLFYSAKVIHHILPFALAVIGYLLLRYHALGGNFGSATQQLPWRTVLLSWPAVLWLYMRAMLWPLHSYSFADPIQIEAFSVREVLIPLIALLCLAGTLASVAVWVRRRARAELDQSALNSVEFALISSSLLLFLPLIPALNLNALNPGDFLHGRYTYLPLVGLTMLAATVWCLLSRTGKFAALGLSCLLLICFCLLTLSQEREWRDDDTLFATAHRLAPRNPVVARHLADSHVQAALRLADEDRCAEAMSTFDGVIRDYSDDWYAWAGRGYCFVKLNQLSKAEESLHRAADLSHNSQVIEQWKALRAHMGLPDVSSH